jgi:hypothetical protein
MPTCPARPGKAVGRGSVESASSDFSSLLLVSQLPLVLLSAECLMADRRAESPILTRFVTLSRLFAPVPVRNYPLISGNQRSRMRSMLGVCYGLLPVAYCLVFSPQLTRFVTLSRMLAPVPVRNYRLISSNQRSRMRSMLGVCYGLLPVAYYLVFSPQLTRFVTLSRMFVHIAKNLLLGKQTPTTKRQAGINKEAVPLLDWFLEGLKLARRIHCFSREDAYRQVRRQAGADDLA